MKFKKIIPYKVIPMLAIAAAPAFTSCGNDDDFDTQKHDVELTFTDNPHIGEHVEQITIENIQNHLADRSVNNIYMRVLDNNDYTQTSANGIHNMTQYFDQRIQLAPGRIFGRGDFNFAIGVADRADSLWFVQHGWTVNQRKFQR